ncbi:neutral zinc metallopeptidase [Alphaproteobacteria bacterium GH1-50]|uniref:Neutral zinc metallopeptidase n=1 Tax=Kangsaoukella pontilimi TaxID=2691042 RepID=A0A7C9IRS8_9RHOB|nr:metallopeptidase family protein [Kangsaoukella pontilimi]MXQ09083.1 neutral zinc metallopeptidase [Kangsaoukella pontilimi]
MEIRHSLAPDAAEIEAIALRTRDALPDTFRERAADVALRVVELADDAMLASVDMDDPFALTGLYDGIPLTEKSFADQPSQPDAIWLFRRAILDEWVDRGDIPLAELVAHVYIHELAHHFGWSDDDIASIDQWWL